MYKAVVELTFGTGGYIGNPHKYFYGRGVAFSNSPKTALKVAQMLAEHACGDGSEWIPVMESKTLYDRNGKVVL